MYSDPLTLCLGAVLVPLWICCLDLPWSTSSISLLFLSSLCLSKSSSHHPSEKANAIADCLETRFTPHELCDENHERRAEARVPALLEDVDNSPPQRIRPCDLQKLIHSLKMRKTCGIDGILNECLRHLPRRPLVYTWHIYSITAFGCPIFQVLGRNQKS
jgi:hypothetical protein